MSRPQKYYEELYFNSGDDRQLLSQNQDAIIELLDKNGAVGVIGLYDQPDYPIYFISGFALTAIGYSYDEAVAAADGSFLNLVYEKDRCSFRETINDREIPSQEFRMVAKSGKNIWIHSYKKQSVSYEGLPIIIISTRVIDDARKRETELLDAISKEYRTIIYADVNHNRFRMNKSAHPGFVEQSTGTLAELEDLLHNYGRKYINPADRSFADILDRLDLFDVPGDKGGSYQAVYRAKTDGEYQWVQFQAFYGGTMNLETGHFILAFKVVDDEKKHELETNRILSDSLAKAQKADQAKNKFLSRMSHDIRTPLNGILGTLEIEKQNLNNPQKISECIEKIALSCDNLMSLMQDVLDMHSLETGTVELMEEPFNLSVFLAEELLPMKHKAEERGLTYYDEMEEFSHPNVVGSPKHILRLFENILSNAIKYNKPNGSIKVTGRETSKNDSVVTFEFSIEDTGIGMQPEFLKNIFEMFEQENNEARTRYMGTGLGMSIVKKLIDQMNGTIEVESIFNEGTKISFTLPFRIAEEDVKEEDHVQIDLNGRHVLIVEDNELNMEFAQFLLESAGMVVTGAVNGKEALDIFCDSEDKEYQLILMDIMMPVMNGLEAAKAIRQLERPDAKSIPIIALSANVMDSDIKKSKIAGMDEHLPKPVNPEQLFNTISKCIGGAYGL